MGIDYETRSKASKGGRSSVATDRYATKKSSASTPLRHLFRETVGIWACDALISIPNHNENLNAPLNWNLIQVNGVVSFKVIVVLVSAVLLLHVLSSPSDNSSVSALK